MRDLEGKVAVVTGAGSGIGRAMALKFAGQGMRLALADVDGAGLSAVKAELEALGCPTLAVPTDVSRREDLERLRDRAVEAFGAVHLLCNNAGVDSGGPFARIPHSTWEWVLGVDLWGAIHGCQLFLPLFQEQGEGHIVNTSSIAAYTGLPLSAAPYAAAKAAVVGLSKNLRAEMEHASPGVGISVLVPGPVRTNMPASERNRPAGVQAPASSAMRDEVQDFIRDYLAREGMDPLEVADLVVGAVRENRFYILTHAEETLAVVDGDRARMAREASAHV